MKSYGFLRIQVVLTHFAVEMLCTFFLINSVDVRKDKPFNVLLSH